MCAMCNVIQNHQLFQTHCGFKANPRAFLALTTGYTLQSECGSILWYENIVKSLGFTKQCSFNLTAYHITLTAFSPYEYWVRIIIKIYICYKCTKKEHNFFFTYPQCSMQVSMCVKSIVFISFNNKTELHSVVPIFGFIPIFF